MRESRLMQVVLMLAVLLTQVLTPGHGRAGPSTTSPAAVLSPGAIRSWDYDAAATSLLLELFEGGRRTAEASVGWQLLAYVQAYRPAITWTQLAPRTNGYTRLRLNGGYHIHLNTQLRADLGEPESRSRAASTLAHEVRHALWNSIWDSNEEEYYCERTAGLAYEEMLLAEGYTADEAAFRARVVYPELEMNAASWVARFDWAPSGFDWAWQSDLARAPLDLLTLFWPWGPLGHPPGTSDRLLGR